MTIFLICFLTLILAQGIVLREQHGLIKAQRDYIAELSKMKDVLRGEQPTARQ